MCCQRLLNKFNLSQHKIILEQRPHGTAWFSLQGNSKEACASKTVKRRGVKDELVPIPKKAEADPQMAFQVPRRRTPPLRRRGWADMQAQMACPSAKNRTTSSGSIGQQWDAKGRIRERTGPTRTSLGLSIPHGPKKKQPKQPINNCQLDDESAFQV